MVKIGIFDSGLGGLLITRAIRKMMPGYDYVYLGDTKRVPYGNRSSATVYEFTRECVDYLFKKENCAIVIIACNTASARALKKIQREYKNKKVLGVLIPAAEEAVLYKRVGVLATLGTVSSGAFSKEIKKLNKSAEVSQNPAPLLVTFAEEGETSRAKPFLVEYLRPLLNKKIQALVLGCTHYPIFKKEIKKLLPGNVKIVSQDEIIPKKLKNYFFRHPEIESKLSRKGLIKILVTDITPNTKDLSRKWFGKDIRPKLINI